jgi:hypothetical protein
MDFARRGYTSGRRDHPQPAIFLTTAPACGISPRIKHIAEALGCEALGGIEIPNIANAGLGPMCFLEALSSKPPRLLECLDHARADQPVTQPKPYRD